MRGMPRTDRHGQLRSARIARHGYPIRTDGIPVGPALLRWITRSPTPNAEMVRLPGLVRLGQLPPAPAYWDG